MKSLKDYAGGTVEVEYTDENGAKGTGPARVREWAGGMVQLTAEDYTLGQFVDGLWDDGITVDVETFGLNVPGWDGIPIARLN